MKKTFLALAAAMMMSIGAMAQQQGPQPRQFDPKEMAKQRTEMMVREYSLSEEQSAKLLDLNVRFADKMPMMGRGFGGQRGQRPQAGEQRRPQRNDTTRQGGPRAPRGERPQMNREEMMKQMEAYNNELKEIMTEEQYQKYQENQQRRMQQGPRNRREGGERPQRQNNG
ncbi:MAG: DUF4890 domain-containing protein [Prevotella sp.]|jgi:hypothetical protein|nr:DUF4890 domain-containing protein [Prevotella sp.]